MIPVAGPYRRRRVPVATLLSRLVTWPLFWWSFLVVAGGIAIARVLL